MYIKDIINGCIEQDPFYQHELVKRHSAMLFAVVRRYVRNEDDAKDILQDAFITIFDHIGQLKHAEALEAWMRKIAVRTALRSFRKRYKTMESTKLEDVQEPVVMPQVYGQLGAEQLIALIQTLPEGYRQVFNLYVIEEYSHKEISDLLGIEESSSRSQLTRARKMLQKLIIHQEKIAI